MSAPAGEKVARTPPSANAAACKEDTRRVRLEGESCHPDYSSLKRVSFFILNENTEKRPHRIRSAMSAPTGEKVARMPPSANAAACIKKRAVLKVIKLNQGQPYDFLLFIASV